MPSWLASIFAPWADGPIRQADACSFCGRTREEIGLSHGLVGLMRADAPGAPRGTHICRRCVETCLGRMKEADGHAAPLPDDRETLRVARILCERLGLAGSVHGPGCAHCRKIADGLHAWLDVYQERATEHARGEAAKVS
jgi:hypothetical protein